MRRVSIAGSDLISYTRSGNLVIRIAASVQFLSVKFQYFQHVQFTPGCRTSTPSGIPVHNLNFDL